MTYAILKEILSTIAFTDVSGRQWEFLCDRRGDVLLLFARFDAPDCNTGELARQTTRKWFVSEHATRSEVLFTALACVKMGLIHEAHEAFLVDGRPLVNPHVNADLLAQFNVEAAEDARQHVDA